MGQGDGSQADRRRAINIAELFVRISGDTSGLDTSLVGAQRGLTRFGTTATSAGAGANRLRGGLLALATQATGANPAVARLASVLAGFAVSGPIVIGVLTGVAAVGFAWNRLTKDAREAKEEHEKLGAALVKAAQTAVDASAPKIRENAEAKRLELLEAVRQRTIAQRRAAVGFGDASDEEEKVRLLTIQYTKLVRDLRDATAAHRRLWTEAQSLDEIGVSVDRLTPAAQAAAKALEDMVNEAARITQGARIPTEVWTDTVANLDAHLKAGRITLQTWHAAVGEATKELGEAVAVTVELTDAQREALGITASLRTPTEVYRDRLRELAEHLKEARITQDTFNRGVTEAAEVLTEATEEINRFAEEAEHVVRRGIDAFASFATGAGGSIHDFVQGALRDLARLMLKMAIIEGVKKVLGGSSGGIGGFLLGALEHRAGGGHVNAGQAYMVGERGRELFVPSSSGSIVANDGGAALSSLPPIPRPMSPNEAAIHHWYREFIRLAVADNAARG